MSSTDNMIILKSSDGESFKVKEAVARRSPTISDLIDGGIPDDGIRLEEVTRNILSKVIEYCEMHVVDGDDLKAWDAEFVNVDRATLFPLMKAAHHLKIKSLVDLTTQNLADRLKGKTREEMAEIWGVEIDDTDEELNEFVRENSWAFE